MLKIAVFLVCVVAVLAKPGYLGGYPSAISHVARVDVHAKPIVSTYATPYYAEPLGYGGSGYGQGIGHGVGLGVGLGLGALGHGAALGHGYGYPLAQSYSNRVDIHDHATPVIAAYGHGDHYGGYGYGGYGWDY